MFDPRFSASPVPDCSRRKTIIEMEHKIIKPLRNRNFMFHFYRFVNYINFRGSPIVVIVTLYTKCLRAVDILAVNLLCFEQNLKMDTH